MPRKVLRKSKLSFSSGVMPLWVRVLLCVVSGIVLLGAVGVMLMPQEAQLIPVAVAIDSSSSSQPDSDSEEPPVEESSSESSVSQQEPPPDYSGQRIIALTFDDGPGEATNGLLDILAEHEIPATFFVLGSNVDRRPEIAQRIVNDGHEIATHTYSHANLTKLTPEQIREEIRSSQDAISRATGGTAGSFLRPPGGSYDETVQQICQEEGLPIIMWSVDSNDWRSKDATEPIIQNVFGGPYPIGDRSILLMHDIYSNSVRAFEQILNRLEAEGYTFVTVSELLNANGGTVPGEVYRQG